MTLLPPWSRGARAMIAWSAALSFCFGCSRPLELSFSTREEISKLPAKHQQQIGESLTNYFGTPVSPRLLTPAAEQSDEGPPKLVDLVGRPELRHGFEVYTKQCAGCHGTTGDGNGPAAPYLNPPPRDYRLGRFKFASTPRGVKPRREDLVRVIRRGAKGTSMPAFRWLAEEDLQAVIDYVIMLSHRGELEVFLHREAENELDEADDLTAATVAGYATRIKESWNDANSQIVLPLTPQPLHNEESVKAGAKAFIELNCFKCHGKDGRGNKAFNVGKDDWGKVAFAADLTSGMLHGGRRPIDIYRRIYSGINATPMPAFNTPDPTKNETPEQRSQTIWNLVHFVTSIVDGKPLPMDVIDAAIKAIPQPAGDAQPAAPAATEEPKS